MFFSDLLIKIPKISTHLNTQQNNNVSPATKNDVDGDDVARNSDGYDSDDSPSIGNEEAAKDLPSLAGDTRTTLTMDEISSSFAKLGQTVQENSSKETEASSKAEAAEEDASLISCISEPSVATESMLSPASMIDKKPVFRVQDWDRKTRYSDYIYSGLQYLGKLNDNTTTDRYPAIMLYESPSTAGHRDSKFYNGSGIYKIHDYPPTSAHYKMVLGPCRYSCMNGSTLPSFLEQGTPPPGLVEHWKSAIPGFTNPTFVPEIHDDDLVYAYLPCESIVRHVNDPYTHYHLAGKDALHLITSRTTRLLPSTAQEFRPCVAKTTHSMASKGIFVIENDDDEREFHDWLLESGNPSYVVTEFVDIKRNVACHFFLHPDGTVTWFGSNENYQRPDGSWSMDSYLFANDQEELKRLQMPYVQDIIGYCQNLGFWGFMGIDVLFDTQGKGYIVDLNPRVTGSCPSLMVLQLLQAKYGYEFGLFRRNGGNTFYHGSSQQLLNEVTSFNRENEGKCQIVLFALCELCDGKNTEMNIGVYAHSVEECESILNRFALAET